MRDVPGLIQLLSNGSSYNQTISKGAHVKMAVRWQVYLRHLYPRLDRLIPGILCIQRSPETSCTLLVHFRSRCHSIDSHEEQLLRFNFFKEVLNIVEDG